MKSKPRGDQLLTPGDAARVLGISADMVRYLARTGQLPAQRCLSGARVFRFEDVDRLARARAHRRDEPVDAA